MDDAEMIVSYDFQQALEVSQRKLDNDTELSQNYLQQTLSSCAHFVCFCGFGAE